VGRVRSRGGAVAALCAAAMAVFLDAGAAASEGIQKARFRVTLSGTISSAVNTFPDATARCRPTTELGVWRLLTFRSARPTLVTVVGGRGSSQPIRFGRAKVRRLLGEIHVAAPEQYELKCADGSSRTVRGDYFTGSTAWHGGAVRLVSPKRGRIVVGPMIGIPQDPGGACGQSEGPPVGVELAPGRMSETLLFNRFVKRLVIRGGLRRSRSPSTTCNVTETVDWELIFRRVR
jgi:hypothetical protein